MVRRTTERLRHARRGVVLAVVAMMMLIGALAALADHPASSGFDIEGTVPDGGAFQFTDPFGNTKELGPLNSNTTKLGVIHTDALPTLGTSNPNGQVDLVNVWFDTSSVFDAGVTTNWLYFAWQRDSTNGSGVIAIEFQQDAAPLACDYAGATEAELIAGCNPWATRQEGDFLLVWDQVGNDIQISVRFFDGTVFGAPVVLNEHEAEAALSADTSRGEAVVNIEAFFGASTECLSIANVIPGTITGNSDTADYKDTVLADIADAVTISNCGSVKVTKTDDDDPAAPLAGAVFTLYESDGDDDFEPEGDDPTATDPDGVDLTCTTGTNGMCVIDDIAFGEYWIDETTVPADHDKASGLPAKLTISDTTQVTVGPFVNPRHRGSIIVEKVLDGSATRVEGAAFAIDADGDPETTGDQTTIPAVAGEDGLFCIDGLLFGSYTVVETTVPTGYEAVTVSQTHEVSTKSDCATRLGDEFTPDLTFENTKLTTLVTSANQSVVIGNQIADTATLSGGADPTGTITFDLYDNDQCTGTALHTETATVNGNGSYGPATFTPTSPGTYYWKAVYSGDSSNAGSTHDCAASGEVDTVIKASPTIATSADQTEVIGDAIHDTAVLSSGYQPTGTITFDLYDNDQCDGTPVFSTSVAVSGNGSYGPVQTTPLTPDTYYWIASYSGDDNNDPVAGSCGDDGEVDTVIKASPSLSTEPMLLPNDDATLSGGHGTLGGTLTFELFDNAACTGDAIYEETVSVSGAVTYSTSNTTVFITADGTYSWMVTYSGDDNNNEAFSACDAEQVEVDFTPLVS